MLAGMLQMSPKGRMIMIGVWMPIAVCDKQVKIGRTITHAGSNPALFTK